MPDEDGPLYTLPVEFRGSFLVFFLLLASSVVKPSTRMIGLLACALYLLLSGTCQWQYYLFVIGVIFAEFRLIRCASPPSLPINVHITTPRQRFRKCASKTFWIAILILALWIGSWPSLNVRSSPGYRLMESWTPDSCAEEDYLFWLSQGAVLLLFALEHLDACQRFFSSRLLLYLGDISFSLYILHDPFISRCLPHLERSERFLPRPRA